jgi:flagellar biosynthesis/type III secretory pathway protein FliH
MYLEFHWLTDLEGMTMGIKNLIADLIARYRNLAEETPGSSLSSPDAVAEVNAAHEAGRKAGYEVGHNEGYKAGRDAGHEAGHAEGYEAGQEAGHETGYAKGYEAGREAGHEPGYERGYDERYRKGLEARTPPRSDSPPQTEPPPPGTLIE